jgi:hypothetical protein
MDQDQIEHREDVMHKLDQLEIEIDRLKQLSVKQHDIIMNIQKYFIAKAAEASLIKSDLDAAHR